MALIRAIYVLHDHSSSSPYPHDAHRPGEVPNHCCLMPTGPRPGGPPPLYNSPTPPPLAPSTPTQDSHTGLGEVSKPLLYYDDAHRLNRPSARRAAALVQDIQGLAAQPSHHKFQTCEGPRARLAPATPKAAAAEEEAGRWAGARHKVPVICVDSELWGDQWGSGTSVGCGHGISCHGCFAESSTDCVRVG